MSISKKTFRSKPFQGIFAQGTRVGDMLYLAGQVSMDDGGNVVAPGDFGKQLAQCYANADIILREFGGDMSNVIDETLVVTGVSHVLTDLETFGAVRENVYGAEPEVSQTLVQVAGLVTPDLLVELKCVAHL
jgi:enamine deaminase RidA (YjgF/YER057c/UK114 family)